MDALRAMEAIMDMGDLPIMAALKKRLSWLQANQRVISQNVANADTPGYRANKLEEQNFAKLVNDLDKNPNSHVMGPSKLRGPRALSSAEQAAQVFEDETSEVSPTGNSVELEDEMLKLADNQMQYGLVTQIYRKNVSLLKTVLGRGSGV